MAWPYFPCEDACMPYLHPITVFLSIAPACRFVVKRYYDYSKEGIKKILDIMGASTLVPESEFLACGSNLEELGFADFSKLELKEDGRYLVIPETTPVRSTLSTVLHSCAMRLSAEVDRPLFLHVWHRRKSSWTGETTWSGGGAKSEEDTAEHAAISMAQGVDACMIYCVVFYDEMFC